MPSLDQLPWKSRVQEKITRLFASRLPLRRGVSGEKLINIAGTLPQGTVEQMEKTLGELRSQ